VSGTGTDHPRHELHVRTAVRLALIRGSKDMKRISWAAIAAAVLVVSFLALSSLPPAKAGNTLVVDEDGYGSASDCDATDVAAYSTIQAAIAAATADDTISVCPGTYVESGQIVISQDLSIAGAGASTTIIKPAADTGSSGDARGWFLVNSGVTFNLSDVTLDGTGRKVYQAIRDKGQGTISDCEFTNIKFEESGPSYAGTAIAVSGSSAMNVDVTGCAFSGIGRVGVLYFGSSVTDSTFSGNTYTGKGSGDWLDYAVEAGAGAIVTISDNDISGNTGVASVDGSTSAGIIVTTYYGSGTQATISGNDISGCTAGIGVGYDGSDTSVVAAHSNNLTGNATGIDTTAPLVDATDNWWGSANGPQHASNTFNVGAQGDAVSDNVTFVPWLDAPAPGGDSFAPVTTTDPVGSYASIQAGIDASNAGGDVNAAAGTYTESLNVASRSDISVVGADRDTTIVKPATTSSWAISGYPQYDSRRAAVRVVSSTDIDFSGFTFDFDLVKGNNVAGLFYWDSTGVISDNALKNMTASDAAGFYGELTSYVRAPSYSDGARAEVEFDGNVFTETGRLGIVTHDFVHATIHGNTFTKTTDDFGYAMEIGSRSTATVSENTISGYDTPAASDQSQSAGIYIENSFTGGLGPINKPVTVSDNTLTGNQYGVYIGNEFDGYAGNVDINVTLTGNNIHDNTDGGVYVADEDRENGSSVTLNASENTVSDNGGEGYHFFTYRDGEIHATVSGDTISGQQTGVLIDECNVVDDPDMCPSGASNSLYDIVVGPDNEITDNDTGIGVFSISGVVIEGNEIHHNVNRSGYAGAGIMFWGDSDNEQVLENVVHDNDRQGIFLGHDTAISTGSVISGNTVYNNGRDTYPNPPDASAYGIQLWNADDNTITNNEVYGQDDWIPYPEYPDFDFAQGIYLFESNNNTVTGNYLHDNNYGVGVWGPDRGDGSNLINLNNVSDNTGFGVMNYDALVIDATGNWWGDASGPYNATNNSDGTGDAVSGNMAYSPWLGIGTDSSGDIGFQPVSPMTFIVEPQVCLPVGCIQQGVNLSGTPDTLEVKAGTYDEQVVIDKPLTVNGAGQGVTVIAPSPITVNSTRLGGSSPGSAVAGIVVIDGTTGVTIRDLTVDGAGNALTACDPPALFGVFWRNASGIIEDSEVRNIEWGGGHEGCQGAIGIFAESGGGGGAAVTIDGNNVHDVQKNGITAVGSATTATISGNTVVGWGPTNKIAQNGIEIASGAGGSITGNEASLYDYTPSTWAATGILVTYAADGVVVSGNNVHDNMEGIFIVNYSTPTMKNMTVSGNTVLDTRDVGVYLLLVDDSEVSSNAISSSGIGLYLADSSDIVAELNTISDNGDGVVVDGESNDDTFTNNKINDNTNTGVTVAPYVVDPSGLVFRLNQIAGNGTYGIDNTTGNVVDALSNWWGHATGPYHPTTNPFGQGNEVSDNVLFDPWLKGVEYVGDTSVMVGSAANLRARFLNSDDTSPSVAGIQVYFDLVDSHSTTVSGSPFSALTQSDGVASVPVSGLGVDVYTVTARHDPLEDSAQLVVLGLGDSDGDTIIDTLDNCPTVYNPDQTNTDAKPIDNGPVVPGDDITVPNGDSLGDACDTDDDNDFFSDAFEAVGCGSGPTNPLLQDTDGDRVVDGAECLLGSDPNNPNSKPSCAGITDNDRDCLPANVEAIFGSSDNLRDTDGDGISDGVEVKGWGTSPTELNTDGDRCDDDKEIVEINGDGVANALDEARVALRIYNAQDDDPNDGNPIPDLDMQVNRAFDINKDGVMNALDPALVALNSSMVEPPEKCDCR
jgi:parallel beta-helix repeat protein